MGDVNINSIINCQSVKSLLPMSIRGRFSAKIVYKFGKTIGGKILNYNQSLKNSGLSSYEDIVGLSCDCADSPFKNSIFDHVITGNLDIIQNADLRELCSFGTKFRENPILDIAKLKGCFGKNVTNFVTKVSRKFDVPRSAFKKWQVGIMKGFLNLLSSLFCFGLPKSLYESFYFHLIAYSSEFQLNTRKNHEMNYLNFW